MYELVVHTRVGSGFTTVPGGPAYVDRSVFSYHYYCWFIVGGGSCELFVGYFLFG